MSRSPLPLSVAGRAMLHARSCAGPAANEWIVFRYVHMSASGLLVSLQAQFGPSVSPARGLCEAVSAPALQNPGPADLSRPSQGVRQRTAAQTSGRGSQELLCTYAVQSFPVSVCCTLHSSLELCQSLLRYSLYDSVLASAGVLGAHCTMAYLDEPYDEPDLATMPDVHTPDSVCATT